VNFDPLAIALLPWHGDGDGGPARAPEPEPKQSIWKRDLSLRRRRAREDEEPAGPELLGDTGDLSPAVAALYESWQALGIERHAVENEPEPAVADAAPEQSAPFAPGGWGGEPEPASPPSAAWLDRPEPVAREDAAERSFFAAPGRYDAEETDAPGTEPEPAGSFSWSEPTRETPPAWDFDPQPVAHGDLAEEPALAGFVSGAEDEPAAGGPGIEPELDRDVFPYAPEPVPHGDLAEEPALAGFVSDAEDEPAADGPGIEPELDRAPALPAPEPDPEPGDELPPAAERKPPFWKREVSFRRARKVAGEELPVAAEERAPAREPEPEPSARPKRRRSFRRARREAAPETAAAPVERKPGKKPKQKSKRAGRGSRRGGVKIVGLKLGASQIAAAHVRSNGSIEVLKVARTPLEKGVVVGGEVRDPDQLAEALRAFFKANKLPKHGVRLGIASNRVGVRTLDVVGVDDPSLLANAVRFRAQEVLPIPLSDAVLDYRVLAEETGEDGELHRTVLVAFAYRELVDRYLAACRKAGVRLAGIDLEGFALLRALVDPAYRNGRPEGAAVVTVSLGHDRSIVSVSDGSVCEFTRVIEWGGGALDTAVARILALTPSQAEPIKRALTLETAARTPEGLNDEQASRARAGMLHEVSSFARELVSSLQFYQGQPGSLDIGEIVVTGGTAHMPGLIEELRRLTGVGVRLGDPLVRVKDRRNLDEESIGSLALAIGLGIED
jgi:type IV pilus assembly protein PilM